MTGVMRVSIIAFALTAAASFAFTWLAVPILRRWKMGQTIRGDGPRAHFSKSGTPTMGGTAFLAAFALVFIPASWSLGPERPSAFLLSLGTLAFGAIGFIDDFLKVARRRPLGIRARTKLLLQVMVAVFLALAAPSLRYGQGARIVTPTWLNLPYGLAGGGFDLGRAYTGFGALAVLSAANAANLTDGLDGLLAGSGGISLLAFWAISCLSGRIVPALCCACMAGSLLGFLPHNLHPARVFMGDTGALAVGGGLATVALLTGTEAYLPLVCGVFVVEATSVIFQVLSFRLFGRRIFRMSPLHHHFELGGWDEKSVVRAFWAASAALGLAGVLGFINEMGI